MDIGDIRSIYGTRTPRVIGRNRFYSVLVPFCTAPELSLVYEVRSGTVSQPGEVCFPGGHMEEGETPEECAVRETSEELGLRPGDIHVIGQGDTLYGNGNFILYTFIGEIDPDSYRDAVPDKEEVKETFTVPLSSLLDAHPRHYWEKMKAVIEKGFPYEEVGINEDYPWHTPSAEIPVYNMDGRIIWGLTARITEALAETLKEGR